MRKAISILLALSILGALTVGAATAPAGKRTTRVTVGNNFFAPEKKTVKKGTKVKFKWDGGGLHNVTKRKGPGGKIKSKTTRSSGVNFKKKFKQRGKYKFICTVHPRSMKLTLRVR